MKNDLIRKLVEAYGPSGVEEQIRAVIRAEVEPLADELRVDPLGSLVARKQGSGEGQRIALAAHMDEIGVMATYVDEKGFVRFTAIGGVSALTSVGTLVEFGDGMLGVIGLERKRDDANRVPKLSQLYIDVGATSRDDCRVHIGDSAVFVRPFATQGSRLIAKAMDDRIGCAVLIETLRRLEQTPHDIYLIFSTQEETTL
jgi:putative aminopeptidase FrvX